MSAFQFLPAENDAFDTWEPLRHLYSYQQDLRPDLFMSVGFRVSGLPARGRRRQRSSPEVATRRPPIHHHVKALTLPGGHPGLVCESWSSDCVSQQ